MYKIGTIYKLNIKPIYSELEGKIAGIFAGDDSHYFDPKGYNYQLNIHFGICNIDYALYVWNFFEIFFQKKFRLRKDSQTQI